MSNIGEKLLGLKVARERANKTQLELANFINVTVDTVKKYENGKKGCKRSRLPRIMDFLNIDEASLLNPPKELPLSSPQPISQPVVASVDLTFDQERAVNLAPLNAMVLAGAGSGKTRVVVERVMKLMRDDAIPASGIVVITFTEKAADELKERIGKAFLNKNGSFEGLDEIFIGTIHKYCNQLIRKGIHQYLSYELLDGTQQYLFIQRHYNAIVGDLNGLPKVDGGKCNYAGSLKLLPSLLNILREGDLNLSQVPEEILLVARKYEELLHKYRLLDFSSLLKIVYEGLIYDQNFQEIVRSSLKYLIVDEYQDTNTMQEKVISGLVKVCGGAAGLTVVGDDDQSIYGWNNARIENLISFPERYGSVSQVSLMDNFRSGAGVLDCAYRVVGKNGYRIKKAMNARSFQKHQNGDVLALEFESDAEEASWIAEKVRFFEGYPYQESEKVLPRGVALSDMAVLVRSKAQSEAIIAAFEKQGIRYQFKGNIGLVSGSRLGQALASIFFFLSQKKNTTAMDVIRLWKDAGLGVPSKQIESAVSVLTSFREERFSGDISHALWSPQRALHLFLAELSLNEDTIPNTGGNSLQSGGEQAFWLIGQFSALIAKFESVNAGRKNVSRYYNNLADYLEYAADDTFVVDNQFNQEQNAVSILTIHASKGLEWPMVFMPGMGRNRFPVKRPGGLNIFHVVPEVAFKDPEAYRTPRSEERRLAFVAMTRAEKFLFMSWAKGKKNEKGNYGLYGNASEFFEEVCSGHDNYVLREFKPELYSKDRLTSSPSSRVLNSDISFSSIFEYRGCPYAYKLRNVYGLTPYYDEAIGFGQVLHNCVHDYHEQRRRDGKEWSEAELEALLQKHFHLPFNPSSDLRMKLRASALRRFKAHHHMYQDLPGIEFLEKDVSLFVHGNRLDGRLDMLRSLRDGMEEIIDFKSAKRGTNYDPSETVFQLMCYALAHQSNTGKKPDYIKPVYIESENNDQIPIVVTDDDLSRVNKELNEYVAGIEESMMPRKPCSPSQCVNCDVAVMCQKGRSSAKEKLALELSLASDA